MKTEPIAISLVTLSTFFTAVGQFFFKVGANFLVFDFLKIITNYYLIIAFILYIVAALFLIYSLKKGELSVIYPILSLSYIWVLFISYYFLGESMNVLKISGIGFILFGVVFIGLGNKK
jgi:drug/metabolite transporter (DMT)-like permease